ncbi:MAG: hypothetical protein DDT40_01588 [candidate division WS2 bacterium]|nr:hypothetical protein [Candidatus Psychracetigena formicireducens]
MSEDIQFFLLVLFSCAFVIFIFMASYGVLNVLFAIFMFSLIFLVTPYWYITLASGAFLLVGLWIQFKKDENIDKKGRQREEAARKAAEEARIRKHKETQDGYQKKLEVLGENSITLFEQMPKHLKTAEEYLNQAEIEFSEGAFAPFWDAIEKTAKTLGLFNKGVQDIKNNSSQYTDLITKYEDVPPQFPLSRKSAEKLGVGTLTAERMKEIVHTAQRNFQFATIYEQRKTNQILVAGFTNLAQALDRMAWQITDSIDSLAFSVDSMASTLNESMNTIHSRLGDMAEADTKHYSEVVKSESDRAAREQRTLQMLDNIQRHRRPII